MPGKGDSIQLAPTVTPIVESPLKKIKGTPSYKPQESNSPTMDQLRLYKAGFNSEFNFYGDVFSGENISGSWKKHCKRLQADYKKYIQAHPTASWFNGTRIESWIVEQLAE